MVWWRTTSRYGWTWMTWRGRRWTRWRGLWNRQRSYSSATHRNIRTAATVDLVWHTLLHSFSPPQLTPPPSALVVCEIWSSTATHGSKKDIRDYMTYIISLWYVSLIAPTSNPTFIECLWQIILASRLHQCSYNLNTTVDLVWHPYPFPPL